MLKKKIVVLLVLFSTFSSNIAVFAESAKYPDYAYEFLGTDKLEKFNRKVFKLNQSLNKYAIRPIHIIWASIIPQYGMDRFYGISNNVEYPIRLVSSLIQRDFQTSKNETIRFLTNTTIGLGGMYDPAKRLFKLEQAKENMEQALAKCHLKSGTYIVIPILSFTTVRGILGKLLDTALNPTSYIGTPVLAMIKAGLTVNRTSYIQTLLAMVEANYADTYDITKKAFGINNYLQLSNMDRVEVLSKLQKPVEKNLITVRNTKQKITNHPSKNENIIEMDVSSQIVPDTYYIDTELNDNEYGLKADINLPGYNPQNPVVDSMRTALFDIPEAHKSIWNELSLWNRSFANRIKKASVAINDGRDDYKFRYLLQKNKYAPLAIIYPSIGESIMSEHSIMLAKILYDNGFSILIQGSHFNWEFAKSMNENYYPGLPEQDAKKLREITRMIVNELETKNDCKFDKKVVIGTSFGALAALFVAAQEDKENKLGKVEYISICPPISLVYAMKQVDKITEAWNNMPENFKDRVALAAAKVVKLYQSKGDINFDVNNLPFSEDEGMLITGFLMHQKLSDLIFTLENSSKKNSEIYESINNMGYNDYAQKYLVTKTGGTVDDLDFETGLKSISDYLEHGKNYKIYHSLNDYLTNTEQLKRLKKISGNRLLLVDNGAHLGFLYRKEFLNHLQGTIQEIAQQ